MCYLPCAAQHVHLRGRQTLFHREATGRRNSSVSGVRLCYHGSSSTSVRQWSVGISPTVCMYVSLSVGEIHAFVFVKRLGILGTSAYSLLNM